MMKLIVGLGNPGRKFVKTRHNVGHMFVVAFGKQLTASSRAVNGKPKVVYHRTTVFMNDSGKEVKKLTTDYRLMTNDLLVVHDDMDLPLGKFKLQFGRGAAGHKGVQSIIDELKTKGFWRLRIGIGAPPEGVAGEDYVLEKFSREELKILQKPLEEAYLHVLEWISSS